MRKFLTTSILAASIALAGCSGAADETATGDNVAAGAEAESEALTFNTPVDNDVLTKMFQWWNTAYKNPEGFTPEAFGTYFTDDAVMRINGKKRVSGLDDLATHFRKIQADTDKVVINLPFIRSFSSPDGSKIFTYHSIDAAANGEDSNELVMGYAEIRDGKISVIDFLSVDGTHEAYETAE
ncbi:hypothetical protein [Altericroceibacterium endophyticum]|uniref:Nuclear transport factor 2 family protein n=1 Tax=Altericroceibacterium endophyticum TaxID=1808508 RepID=A0A6I4T8P0_9SPHN|nr:hypothetical protein [Altericroceibacterium endophyticum]MXO67058.1 hypothetical protein [Altericroceibacterium endophyticum]